MWSIPGNYSNFGFSLHLLNSVKDILGKNLSVQGGLPFVAVSAVLLDSFFRGSNSGQCNKTMGLMVVKM